VGGCQAGRAGKKRKGPSKGAEIWTEVLLGSFGGGGCVSKDPYLLMGGSGKKPLRKKRDEGRSALNPEIKRLRGP